MLKFNVIFVCLVLYGPNCIVSSETTESYNANDLTLEYVTSVFRHGERTVDASTLYPKDPYLNESYYPFGIGQLTAKGKEREYSLGQLMRKRYDALLGNVYVPEILDPISTDMNRTKASLTLVLAGLYPPKGNIMEWNPILNWQPIPYNYVDYIRDQFFSVAIYFCPNYIHEYAAFVKSPEGKKLQEQYEDLFEYLRDHTGKNITRLMEVFFVHSCLQSQIEWGLPLPDWAEKVFPERLTKATIDGLASGIATKKLKQLSGGLFIKRILEQTKAKAAGTMEPDARKMALYSGHDINIVYLLGVLNVFTPHIVPYGACVFLELHKINNVHYVKVLYVDYSASEPRTLILPGCERLCPLDKFESLVKDNIPEKENPCGDDDKVLEEHSYERDYYAGRVRYKNVVKHYRDWHRDIGSKLKKSVVGSSSDFLHKYKDSGKAFLDKVSKLKSGH